MTDMLFVALLILLVVGLSLEWFFLSRLKRRHVQTWVDLGFPSLFVNNSIGNALKILRFKWSQDYKKLNDTHIDEMVFAEKWLFGIYLVLFSVLILSTLGLSIK